MGAGRYSLQIEQGATWRTTLTLRDTDLTGYTARMQVRTAVDAVDVLLELSTTNGKITVDGAAGQLALILTDDETAALTWTDGVYDLEIYSAGGETTRLIHGTVTVSPEVTR